MTYATYDDEQAEYSAELTRIRAAAEDAQPGSTGPGRPRAACKPPEAAPSIDTRARRAPQPAPHAARE